MGWLNTVLDVASLTVQVSQLGKLEDMRNQGATSAMMQAVLQELRNQIFNFKQAAQTIVDSEAADPKAAAGALRVVELRLNDSGISTDLFSDLNDKEYVAGTYKFVTSQSQRLKQQLPAAVQDEMEQMAHMAHQLPEYGYYLNHFDDFKRYLDAKLDKEKYGRLTAGGGLWLGCGTLLLLMVIGGFFATIFRKSPMTGLWIGGAIVLGIMFYVSRFARRGNDGKKIVAELEKRMDIEYLQTLDQKFQGNRSAVEAQQAAARDAIKKYFGDSPLLPV